MKFRVCGFLKEDTVVQNFRKDVGFCSETATMPCVSACALFLEMPYASSQTASSSYNSEMDSVHFSTN